VKMKVLPIAASLCLLLAGVVTASASTVTYTFNVELPTINGPVPGSFVLTVPTFVTGTPLTEFIGTDFSSCSAPGTGACIADFSVGPSPISGASQRYRIRKRCLLLHLLLPGCEFYHARNLHG
jgi:hypothetical protein